MIDYLNRETYNFYLPENLIATTPNYERDHCKLMTISKDTGKVEHKIFSDIINYLNKDDILVLNDSKVIPARIYAKKNTGGNSEILLLNKFNNSEDLWECLIKGKNIKENDVLYLDYSHIENIGIIEAFIIKDNISTKLIKFSKPLTSNILDRIGKIPLPPYIIQSRKKKGEEEYLYDDKALEKYRKTHKAPFTLQRYKGLGEMDAEQLWETTLNPETRMMQRVEIEDARLASNVTRMLMGTEVPPRKEFIHEHAQDALLDV